MGKTVAVVGGGNVAMDSARCARRLAADDVVVLYRRTEAEMPARAEEIENAKEEGIRFEFLTTPVRISGKNGWAAEAECVKNRLGEPDISGRRRPIPIEGSNFTMKTETFICAIGQGPNPLLLSTVPELRLTPKGKIEADENGRTSIPDVFAGGDIVEGRATVIWAMGAAKRAAGAIDEYLRDR